MTNKPLIEVMRKDLHQMLDNYFDRIEKRIRQKAEQRKPPAQPKPASVQIRTVVKSEEPTEKSASTDDPNLNEFFNFIAEN